MEERMEVEEVLELLCEVGGRPRPDGEDDILLTLIQAILSQATNRQNADQAFDDLMESFAGDLEAIAQAEEERVAEAIAVGGLSEQKAPRIQSILRKLQAERGELSMEFLRRREPEQARAYLESFKGVGPKTAAFVLMWAAGMPLFPMNTGILRIAARLGWIEPGVSGKKAHAQVEPMIPLEERYAAHMVLVRLARSHCLARQPRCESCPLGEHCPRLGIEVL